MLVETPETGSTNDDARELALAGAPHGAAVLAALQRAGRGRAGRAFESPAGGLYLSVVLRPASPPAAWTALPLLVGAAAASALRRRGFPVELKWPNDLVLGARKLGGVLVETRLGADAFAVAGLGVNVLRSPAPEAIALAEHGRAPDARALAEEIRAGILARVARLDAEGPRAAMREVRALCGTLGRRVEWEKGEGLAVDVDDDGALVVEMKGERLRVVAGDVRVRAR